MNSFLFIYGGENSLNCPFFLEENTATREQTKNLCVGNVIIRKPNLLQIENNNWLSKESSVWYFSAGGGHQYNKIKIEPRGNKANSKNYKT